MFCHGVITRCFQTSMELRIVLLELVLWLLRWHKCPGSAKKRTGHDSLHKSGKSKGCNIFLCFGERINHDCLKSEVSSLCTLDFRWRAEALMQTVRAAGNSKLIEILDWVKLVQVSNDTLCRINVSISIECKKALAHTHTHDMLSLQLNSRPRKSQPKSDSKVLVPVSFWRRCVEKLAWLSLRLLFTLLFFFVLIILMQKKTQATTVCFKSADHPASLCPAALSWQPLLDWGSESFWPCCSSGLSLCCL